MTWQSRRIHLTGPLPSPPEAERWLWCVQCQGFFQAQHLRVDVSGCREGCPICSASGFDAQIFDWNSWSAGVENPPWWWPMSTDELHYGLRCDYLNDCEKLDERPLVAIRIWPRDELSQAGFGLVDPHG